MAILGILAVVTLANFSTSQAKGRDAQRKSDLRQLANALEAYYTDHSVYPLGSSGKIVSCDNSEATEGVCDEVACEWTGLINREFCDANYTVYMKEMPTDPVSSRQYYYVSADRKSWKLYAKLENNNDSDLLKNADGTPRTVTLGGTAYTFGISSGNTTP